MKISVIIPVYNVEQYLRECLDSVMTQSYKDYEVICINDGSKDDSMAILQEYAGKYPKISVIDQRNKGLSAARNAGINAATGDYVFFLDSDDWIDQDALKILAEKQDGADMICFNGRRFFEDGTKEEPDKGITENTIKGWDYYNKYALETRKFHFVCVVLRMYKRNFLIQHSLFFEEGIYHEDNLFTPIVCFYAQKVRVIPDILYIYRIRNGSITQHQVSKHIFDVVHIANKLAGFFIPIKDIDKTIVFREIAGEYFKGFITKVRQKNGKNDIELKRKINWKYFREVSVYPRHKRIYWLLLIHPVLFRVYYKYESYLKSTYQRKNQKDIRCSQS